MLTMLMSFRVHPPEADVVLVSLRDRASGPNLRMFGPVQAAEAKKEG